MDVLFWAILVILFVIVEIFTIQLVSIWLAAASLVTMFCVYFFNIPITGQLGIFIASSIVFLALTWPLMKKWRDRKHLDTNVGREINKKAKVIEDIDLDNGTGRVTLDGVDWSALSADGSFIPKGSVVIVKAINGTKLTVELES